MTKPFEYDVDIAERWAKAHYLQCDRLHTWEELSEEQRQTEIDAMLPLVREALGWSLGGDS